MFIIVGNTVGKSSTGHSKPIYLVLKPLNLQNVSRIFDRPVSSMYCKYAEYACKVRKNLPMINKKCHNMQKNAISYCKYAEHAGIFKKNMLMTHDQQKNMIKKMT